MQRALITGVTGFAGQHVAHSLLQSGGYSVFGLDKFDNLKTTILTRWEAEKLTYTKADILDNSKLSEIVEEISPQIVFHFAAVIFVPETIRNPVTTYNVNVIGTVNLLEALRKMMTGSDASPKILIPSSAGVYGSGEKLTFPTAETSPLNPETPYTASKACQELIGRQYFHSFGMNVITTRGFNHIGPGLDERFASSAFAKQLEEIRLRARKPSLKVGNLETRRDFTDIRDVVEAYRLLIDLGTPGETYNVCNGQPTSMGELVESLIELSGVKVILKSDPKRVRQKDLPVSYGDNRKLIEETGWSPKVPIEKSLKDSLAYWEKKLRPSS